jgi:DNA-binding MarR family transcriptional regulator
MKREDILTQLFESMNATKRAMHSNMHILAGSCPISRTQLELLSTITHTQPVSPKLLAQNMQLTPGAISQLVDALFAEGLVTRETDSHDRRVQLLSLSEKGTTVMAEVSRNKHTFMKHIMESLTTEELAVMLRIQQKMIGQLQAAATHKEGEKK